MSTRQFLINTSVYGTAAADQLSNEGVVRAVTSETVTNFILFTINSYGITFGALVSIAVGVGALAAAYINLRKMWNGSKNDINRVKEELNKTDEEK